MATEGANVGFAGRSSPRPYSRVSARARAVRARACAGEPSWGSRFVDAVGRGTALFLGAFTLVSLIGVLRAAGDAGGFDPTVWWIDLPWLDAVAAPAVLAATSLVLVAYAVAPRMAGWRRALTVAVAVALAAATAWNGVVFYQVWRAGEIDPLLPLPLSFLVSAVLVFVAATAAWARPAHRKSWGASVVVLGAAAAFALAFPLGQVFFFGQTDYRREASAAVVFGAQVHNSGTLSTSLRDRMTTAVELYDSRLVTKVLVSGAVGDSGYNEALAMRDFAVASGVPATDVIVDGNGVNTDATVRNTRSLVAGLQIAGGEPPTLLAVSQFYHLPRVKLAYARAGFDVLTVPARGSQPIAQTPYLVAREIPGFWVYYLRAVFD